MLFKICKNFKDFSTGRLTSGLDFFLELKSHDLHTFHSLVTQCTQSTQSYKLKTQHNVKMNFRYFLVAYFAVFLLVPINEVEASWWIARGVSVSASNNG